MANYNSSYTGAQHDTYVTKSQLINLIYPVGAIYISTNSTSPQTLFGGTWAAIEGSFLLASSTQYPAGSSGGNASVTHTHTTGNHVLTVSEMPTHKHATSNYNGGGKTITYGPSNASPHGDQSYWNWNNAGFSSETGGNAAHNHGNTGEAVINTLPPYLAVYMWKRTA